MKKYFVFMAMIFSFWSSVSLGSERQQNDFNDLMQRVANSIKDNALFSELTIPEGKELNTLNTASFRNTLLPSLMAAYEKSRMTNRVIWLNIVREVRKYDRTEIEKSRPNRWYLSQLLNLTSGLGYSKTNNAWKNGLIEAYKDSLSQ